MKAYLVTVLTYLAGLLTPEHAATNKTVYVASVNNHILYCGHVRRDAGCYNLIDCADGNSYFCVSNVEMRVDR